MLPALVACLLTIGLTPLVSWFYRRRGWLDDPQRAPHIKKMHQVAIPRGGGWALFASISLTALLFLQLDHYLVAILSGAALLTLVGGLDDVLDLHPFLRLISNLLVALIVVGSGIGIAYLSNPFGGGVIHLDQPQWHFTWAGLEHSIWILSSLFALLFIIWNMNSVNWSSGLDGQLASFTVAGAFFIGLLSTRFLDDPAQFNTAWLCFIVAGAYLGYLVWNWFPQKSMPGYGGASLAGYLLSVLAILSGAKVATTLLVLAIPTADALFTILRRLWTKRSPFWGDRGHLHHQLVDVLGWRKPTVALFYGITSFTLGLASLYLNSSQKLVTISLVFVLVFAFQLWSRRTPDAKS